MASRIAVRLPLHLQRTSPCVLLSNVALSAVPCNSSSLGLSPGRRLSPAGSGSSFNDRTTFTLATTDKHSRYEPLSNGDLKVRSSRAAEFHTSRSAPFRTHSPHDEDGSYLHSSNPSSRESPAAPGSVAFGECEISALSDLFLQFAKTKDGVNEGAPYLNLKRIRLLLESIGERDIDDATLSTLMDEIDLSHSHSNADDDNDNNNGRQLLGLDRFLGAADRILGKAPARVILVVGGPGSGKGALCERLARDCGAVHLSCGEMLREEVEADTPLGREVADIMSRGDLVSSAVVTALMRRRMRNHPGRRILLDGFPRSLENARDFVELCGPPELALHLDCDDTLLIERILARGGRSARDAERAASSEGGGVRSDDNVHTAIQRLKNYHKHHHSTMSWLKEIRVPIVELDCSGSKEDVWGQLAAIGRLMRPAVKLPQQQQQQQEETVVEKWQKMPSSQSSRRRRQGAKGGMSMDGSSAVDSQNTDDEGLQWIA